MWGGKGLNLTAAAARLWGWGIPKGWAFSIAAWAGAGFQGFIHLVTDDVHQALEHLLHIDILLGAGLKELKTKIIGEPPAILSRYDPFVFQVTLVPHEDYLGIVPGIGFDLRSPVLHRGEGLLVGDVIHEQETHSSAIVGRGDCPVALLACCVPNLQLDPLVMSVDRLDLEVDAHCAHEGRGEGVIGIAEQEGCLAHAAVPDQEQFEHVVKVLVGGSVGKTSFLFRYADDTFTPAFVSTVGIDFKVKTVYRHEKRVKLQIWDTAGQERYRTITTAYYRGAMGFILMYDITNEESFNAVQDWATQIKTYSWDNAQVILVGNKCDMEEERVVPTEKGRLLAEQLGFDFFEASAKENISVRQAFERLVDAICDKMSDSMDTDPSVLGASKTTRLSDTPPLLQQNCSC